MPVDTPAIATPGCSDFIFNQMYRDVDSDLMMGINEKDDFCQ